MTASKTPRRVSSNPFLKKRSEYLQNKIAYVNIGGAAGGIFSLAPSQDPATTPDDVTDHFTRVAGPDISQLYYDGGNWLACPTEIDGQYLVYAEKAWSHKEGKDKCIPFEIRTDKVESPKNCEYF